MKVQKCASPLSRSGERTWDIYIIPFTFPHFTTKLQKLPPASLIFVWLEPKVLHIAKLGCNASHRQHTLARLWSVNYNSKSFIKLIPGLGKRDEKNYKFEGLKYIERANVINFFLVDIEN
jgi:hypothetical protein